MCRFVTAKPWQTGHGSLMGDMGDIDGPRFEASGDLGKTIGKPWENGGFMGFDGI